MPNNIPEIFKAPHIDHKRLAELESIPEPRRRFLIAITPRSGSSYLCDLMKKSKRFGLPDETINQTFIPEIMKKIPGRTPDEYLCNVIRAHRSRNGISGLKASWFQFHNFSLAMTDTDYLLGFRYIYLTRRNLAAQAVSLFMATSSNIFHTNINHDKSSIRKLESLEYNYEKISKWYEHIIQQEKGWSSFFFENRIFPLCVSYEDILDDIEGTLKRIGSFLGIKIQNISMPEEPSAFKRIGNERNADWTLRFLTERMTKHG